MSMHEALYMCSKQHNSISAPPNVGFYPIWPSAEFCVAESWGMDDLIKQAVQEKLYFLHIHITILIFFTLYIRLLESFDKLYLFYVSIHKRCEYDSELFSTKQIQTKGILKLKLFLSSKTQQPFLCFIRKLSCQLSLFLDCYSHNMPLSCFFSALYMYNNELFWNGKPSGILTLQRAILLLNFTKVHHHTKHCCKNEYLIGIHSQKCF